MNKNLQYKDKYLKYKNKYITTKYGGAFATPDLIDPIRSFNYFVDNSDISSMYGGMNTVFRLKLKEGFTSPYVIFNSDNLGKQCTCILVKIIILYNEKTEEKFNNEVNAQVKVCQESSENLESISPNIIYSNIYELKSSDKDKIINKCKGLITDNLLERLKTRKIGIIGMELLESYISFAEYLKYADKYNKLIAFNMIGHSLIRLGKIGIIHEDLHFNNILIDVTYNSYYDSNFIGKIQIIDYGKFKYFTKELTDEFNNKLSTENYIDAIYLILKNSNRLQIWTESLEFRLDPIHYLTDDVYKNLKISNENQIENISKKYINLVPLEKDVLNVFLYYPNKELVLDTNLLKNNKVKILKDIILQNKKKLVIKNDIDLNINLSSINYDYLIEDIKEERIYDQTGDEDVEYNEKVLIKKINSLYLENSRDITEDINLYNPSPKIMFRTRKFNIDTSINFIEQKNLDLSTSSGSRSSSGSSKSTSTSSGFNSRSSLDEYLYKFGYYDDHLAETIDNINTLTFIGPNTINKELFLQPFQDYHRIIDIDKFKRVIEIITKNDPDKNQNFIELLNIIEKKGEFEYLTTSDIMIRIINRSYRNKDNTINYEKINYDILKFEEIKKEIENFMK